MKREIPKPVSNRGKDLAEEGFESMVKLGSITKKSLKSENF
jgi:hypothetical protein